MNPRTVLAFAVGFLFLALEASVAQESAWKVRQHPMEVHQGSVVRIKVDGIGITDVKGLLRQQEIFFFPEPPDSYAALFGVDLEEKPGELTVAIQGRGRDGSKLEKVLRLQVRKRSFPEERFSVAKEFDRFDDAVRERIEKEQARLAQLWTVASPYRFWEGKFVEPVSGPVTSPFGLRRIINGSPRSPHSGVDFKAPSGTQVVATNRARVVLRDEFYFSGKSLVLDHGGGLYTMYFHLADFNIQAGSEVRKGDLIGWAGMTGRVTGPHLHWGVRLYGARVDPLELLAGMGGRP